MSKALFDALGIDETDAIDADEIKAIQLLIGKIKVDAANVAIANDTDDTIAILRMMRAIVKSFGSRSRFDAEQAFNRLMNGQPMGQSGQAALGASNTASAPQPTTNQDELNRTKEDLANANRLLKRMRDKGLIGYLPLDDERACNEEVDALVAVVNEGKAAITKLDEQAKQSTPQPAAADSGLKERNQKMLNDITNVAKLVNSLEHVIVKDGKYEECGTVRKKTVFALPEKLGNKPIDTVLEGQFNAIHSIVGPYLPRQQ